MNTDNSEAMRLVEACKHGWLENVDPDKCSLEDLLTLLRQQAERIAELEASLDAELCNRDVIDKMLEQCIAERDQLQHTATSLLSLLADIRKACGDNGKRMQPELVEFIGSITTDRDLLRAEVIANRERDALKLAALHIHSEMRSIVQAGGSNEAIGREFRKRVILDVEDEVVKLRAEVERLRPNAERYEWLRDDLDSDWSICKWGDDPIYGPGYYRPDHLPAVADAMIDAARTTHKRTK